MSYHMTGEVTRSHQRSHYISHQEVRRILKRYMIMQLYKIVVLQPNDENFDLDLYCKMLQRMSTFIHSKPLH